jgi:predicted esterase
MKIHEGQPVLYDGAPLADASTVALLLHGRGGSGEDMISLGREFSPSDLDIALVAPQAAGGTWYPQRFLAPLAQNEPYLTSALGVVAELIEELLVRGISRDRIVLVGFSQGACLALEFAARHPHRYGGVAGLSGALIGPPGMKRDVVGSLQRTPVFLGCSDADPHVPLESVNQSTEYLRKIHADVVERIYPGMPHTVNAEEIRVVSNLVRQAAGNTEGR